MKTHIKHFILVCIIVSCVAVSTTMAQDDYAVEIQTIGIPSAQNIQFEMSPDGNWLAMYENAIFLPEFTVVEDLLPIRLFDFSQPDSPLRELTGHTDYVVDVTFFPNRSEMVSFHSNGEHIKWDLATGEIITSIRTLVLPQPAARPGVIAALPDGEHIVTRGNTPLYPQVLIWSMETGHLVQLLQQEFESFAAFEETPHGGLPRDSINAYAISPDGTTIVGATINGHLWQWDVATGEGMIIREVEDDGRPSLPIRYLTYSPDGSKLYMHDNDDETIRIWDASESIEIATFPVDNWLFRFVSDERMVRLNETGDTLIFHDLDDDGVPTDTAAIINIQGALEDAGQFISAGRILVAGQLFAAHDNRIVIGGWEAADRTTNFITIFTITLN